MISIWLLRLAFGLLLVFCSEILLWVDPVERPLAEWFVLIPAYLTLATLFLDLAARYRIRSIYDTMTLTAIYGLLAGLLLNPETTLIDFPRTLLTRVIGAQSLLGLTAVGIFALFCSGEQIKAYRYHVAGFSLWEGAYWGIWVRWAPSLINWARDDTPLITLFLFALPVLSIALLCIQLAARNQAITSSDLRLSPVGFGILISGLITLLLFRLIQGVYIDLDVVPISLIILLGCGIVLWFRRTERGEIILDTYIPVNPPVWRWLIISAIVFIGSTILFYSLPLLDVLGYNQLSLMEFGFAAVGFLWFPTIAIIIGGRAIDRQMSRLNT